MRDISSPLDGIASPFGPQRTKTLTQLLFASNEPGFTFEPWDITTLYQDRAGTTPVTAAGQSVGLRLDKSQGLRQGPERVANGSFHSDLSGWTLGSDAAQVIAIWTASGASLTRGAGGPNGFTQTGVAQVGKTYLITFDVVSGTAAFDAFGVSVVAGGAGSKRFIYVASTTSIQFWPTANNATVVIDNISVRELAGNHQVAVSDAKRGVYGWMPKTGRRNLLTYTEQFDNAVWTKGFSTVSANTTLAPDGSTTADTITPDISVNQFHLASQSAALTGQTVVSIYGKPSGYDKLAISVQFVGSATFDLTLGSVISGGAAASIQSVGNGWFRCSYTLTRSGVSNIEIGVARQSDGAWSGWTANGTSGIYIWGAQLEVGSIATAYQRVVSQYDITEAGVPTCYYVQADGVDDAYVTPTITPNTDKVQVFAGVRNLSDADTAIFIEHSASADANAGAFYVANLTDPALQAQTGLIGARVYARYAIGAAPVDVVSTSIIDNSKTGVAQVELRKNGVAQTDVAVIQGSGASGNFLAYPAYIYGRGGTSFPFNGLDFGHAVRFGPNLDAATIARVESLIARNTPEVTL